MKKLAIVLILFAQTTFAQEFPVRSLNGVEPVACNNLQALQDFGWGFVTNTPNDKAQSLDLLQRNMCWKVGKKVKVIQIDKTHPEYTLVESEGRLGWLTRSHIVEKYNGEVNEVNLRVNGTLGETGTELYFSSEPDIRIPKESNAGRLVLKYCKIKGQCCGHLVVDMYKPKAESLIGIIAAYTPHDDPYKEEIIEGQIDAGTETASFFTKDNKEYIFTVASDVGRAMFSFCKVNQRCKLKVLTEEVDGNTFIVGVKNIVLP